MQFDFTGNPQHPALSKLLMSISVLFLGESEFALRLPNSIVSALTVYPIYYLGKEIVSRKSGMIGALLWAIDITSISYTTIAKEDALLTFFWILTVFFCLRIKEDEKYIIFSGISLGLALSSKYTAILLVIYLLVAYLWLMYYNDAPKFKNILKLIPVTCLTFAIANFPIFLPQTIEGLYDHYYLGLRFSPPRGGFIMMGEIISPRPTFYLYMYLFLKLSVPILIFSSIGLIFMLKHDRKNSILLLSWILTVLLFFTGRHGYTRYVLVFIPAILIFVGYGIEFISKIIYSYSNSFKSPEINLQPKYVISFIFSIVWIHSLIVGLTISPYYRMYVNEFGGGLDKAGYYFPQDSVYDFKIKEAIEYVNKKAEVNATIAIDVVIIGEYYGREDLSFVYIVNQPKNVTSWNDSISFAIVQQSRIYNQNIDQISYLRETSDPVKTYTVIGNTVVEIFKLDN